MMGNLPGGHTPKSQHASYAERASHNTNTFGGQPQSLTGYTYICPDILAVQIFHTISSTETSVTVSFFHHDSNSLPIYEI